MLKQFNSLLIKIGVLKMLYPENQITVIDAYYKGSNGWTYSHTLLNDKEVSLDINET